MDEQRRLKKSEFLEVRLPHPTKQAFMARCRSDGRSASETVRGFIESHLSGRSPPRAPRPRLRLAAAGAALLACGLAAAPSFARTTASADFARLDLDRDGRVSLAEFDRGARVQVALAPAASGWLQTVGLAPAPRQPPLNDSLSRAVLAAAFRQIDADRDGSVSLAEYRRWRRG
jgi:hypothetical protein